MKPTLLLLVAGMGSHYGGLKQLDGLESSGGTIMDYSVYDAIKAGFGEIIFVIREDFEGEFKERVLSKHAEHIPAEVCSQSIGKLPENFTVPEGREKPWGTNHAVMMAEELINEPFYVINCNGFYSRDVFMIMREFLASLPEGSKSSYAVVGLRVGNTLLESGTMVRGICEKNGQDNLITVIGRTEIMCANGAVCYKDEQGEWVAIDDGTPVSMNMWGFTPDYFKYSDVYFKEFLSDPKNMGNLKTEFFIPLMANKLVQEETTAVEMLDTTSGWFGVTYAADRQGTVDRIQSLIDQGVYPNQSF